MTFTINIFLLWHFIVHSMVFMTSEPGFSSFPGKFQQIVAPSFFLDPEKSCLLNKCQHFGFAYISYEAEISYKFEFEIPLESSLADLTN